MREYNIEVEEVLQRTVTVEAESIEEALRIVRERYDSEEIVLNAEDLKDVKFNECNNS